MKLDFKIDATKLTSIMKGELAKQARFAVAKTLTGAAWDSREKLQRYIPMWLKTKTQFLQRSIIVEKAAVQRPQATIGFHQRATLVGLLEQGGTRRPERRAIAVPVNAAKTGRIGRSRSARALLQKPNHFSAEIRGVAGIWHRSPRTNRITLVYAYEPRTSCDPKMIRFHDTVKLHAPKFIRNSLMRNLDEAIRTRKR